MAGYGKVESPNDKNNTTTVGELSKVVSILRDAADGFVKAANIIDSAVDELTGSTSRSAKDIDKNNQKVLSKLEGISKQHLTKSQAIQGAFANTLKEVAGFAIKQFSDASNKIISNYNASLTEITVRQQMSNKEYTDALNASTDWIKKNGLKVQFSEVDFTNALKGALSSGLRDIGDSLETQYATNFARQNLITNKLLPQLSTNTRTYTRASKLLGDALSQNITAVGKYTERVYGAEGLEENQVNNVLETIMNEIISGGASRGLSEEEVSRQVANVLGTYQQYSAQYGSAYAEQVLGSLKGIMTGDLSDVMANMAMSSSGISVGDASTLNAESLSRYFGAYTDATRQIGSQAGAGVLSGMAGVGNYDSYLAVKMADAYGSSYQDWMDMAKSFDANAEYQQDVGKLQKGYYQSMDDKMQKWNENTVAKISNTIAQYVPQDAIGAIHNIVNTWFGAWMTYMAGRTVSGLVGGGSGVGLGLGGALAGTNLGKAGLRAKNYALMRAGDIGVSGIAGTAIGAAEAGYGAYLTYDAITDKSKSTGGAVGQGITGAVGAGLGAYGGLIAAGLASGPAAPFVLAAGGIALLASSVIKANTALDGLTDKLDDSQTSFNDMILASDEYSETQKEAITNAYEDLRKDLEKAFEEDIQKYRKSTTEDMITNFYGDEKGFGSIERSSYAGSQVYSQLMNAAEGITDPDKQAAFVQAVETAFASNGGLSKTELRALMGRRTAGTNLRALFSKDIDLKGSWFNTVSDIDIYKDITRSTNSKLYNDAELGDRAIANVVGEGSHAVGSDFITGKERAMLHRGEAVLTSSTASKLRKLANGQSLAGFIDSLYNANVNTSALPENTTVSFDPIVDAIKEQTEELQNSLSEIAVMVAKIVDPSVAAKVDYRLTTYQGAGG